MNLSHLLEFNMFSEVFEPVSIARRVSLLKTMCKHMAEKGRLKGAKKIKNTKIPISEMGSYVS
jgi:hypothetical protein